MIYLEMMEERKLVHAHPQRTVIFCNVNTESEVKALILEIVCSPWHLHAYD